ncbi:MAG: redoxin domain-containing protein [Pseudopedobacter sp.]|nr:redoxin domain-containing protein [Deinococcales bacterium]
MSDPNPSDLIGSVAPDFTLKSHQGDTITLSSFQKSKNVVLVFYPLDFSPVCSMQLPEFSGSSDEFAALDTAILGINRDSLHTHRAWAVEYGIEVPLLADMNLSVAKAYGVALVDEGKSKRATFLIDKQGLVREAHVEGTTGEYTFHPAEALERVKLL